MSNDDYTPATEKAQSWSCPDCAWMQTAHPAYGWAAHDDRAVEVHRTALCPARPGGAR
ncbi:hypothetical protein GCM10009606_17940 [Nocardioides aquiterrae]|uniref:Uncharacterized protein n=1 Tax=Nocardioides aquiterrae TaxID=203799 RepID=A0ABN1UCQ3_9ACTN